MERSQYPVMFLGAQRLGHELLKRMFDHVHAIVYDFQAVTIQLSNHPEHYCREALSHCVAELCFVDVVRSFSPACCDSNRIVDKALSSSSILGVD